MTASIQFVILIICILLVGYERPQELNVYYAILKQKYSFMQKCPVILPVPSNNIPQIHGAVVHIMPSLFPPG